MALSLRSPAMSGDVRRCPAMSRRAMRSNAARSSTRKNQTVKRGRCFNPDGWLADDSRFPPPVMERETCLERAVAGVVLPGTRPAPGECSQRRGLLWLTTNGQGRFRHQSITRLRLPKQDRIVSKEVRGVVRLVALAARFCGSSKPGKWLTSRKQTSIPHLRDLRGCVVRSREK